MKVRKKVSLLLSIIVVNLLAVVPVSGQTENWTISFSSTPGDPLFGAVWEEQLKGIFDLDGDGYGEFITLLVNPQAGNNARLVWVEAQGDNFYTYRELYSWTGLQSKARSLAVGDLDGDGIDEIVACVETVNGVDGMYIFEFDPGTGTFPSTPTTSWDPRTAGYIGCKAVNGRWSWQVTPIIDDIDSDGKNEFISPTLCGTAIFELTTQDYSNPIWEAEYYDTTTVISPWSFAIGDLDGDGRKELYDASAWPQFGKPTVFNILEVTGEDIYELIVSIPGNIMPSTWAGTNGYTVVADLDNDGNQEFYQTDILGNFWVFAPGGDLSNVNASDFYLLHTNGWDIGDMLLGDQDGDGKPNFYIAGHNQVVDVAYQAGGSVTNPLSYAVNPIFEDNDESKPLYPFRLALGNDMDGDDKKEVVFISVNHDIARSTVYVLEWAGYAGSNIKLSLSQINAHSGDSVLVDLFVQFPTGFSCNYAEINIGGYSGLLDFIEAITVSSLTGSTGWTIQTNEADGLQITASAGAEEISGQGVFLRLKFAVPDTAAGFIPITLESAMFNTDDVPVDLTSGGVAVIYQEMTLGQIKTNLLNNPPNTGDPTVREETILALDDILKKASAPASQGVHDFYNSMMEKVKTELQQPVTTEAAIWMMYNHGFLIKTPQHIFAFDLVDGYNSWLKKDLPLELVKQIDVLFISHEHGDHNDSDVSNSIITNGGYVVVPSERSYLGNVPVAGGDELDILGLQIKVHDGLHSVPVRIYEVTTPGGLKLLHTGDNQTSETLPEVDSLDVLLLNVWVNESGAATSLVGVRNSLNKLKPTVMIPGHIQELAHSTEMRAAFGSYRLAFAVDDVPMDTKVQVMAWGERYFFSKFTEDVVNVMFNVSVPTTTPDEDIVYIAGKFNFWDPGPDQLGTDGLNHDLPLSPSGNNQWQVELPFSVNETIEYKFTRGSWATVEVNSQGENIDNRTLAIPGNDFTQNDVVAQWVDFENMLTNGDFSNGDTGWLIFIHELATASGGVQDGEYAVSINNGSNVNWHIQLLQIQLLIENGKTYSVSFEAYAASPRQIGFYVRKDSAPHTVYSGYQYFSLTTSKQKYSHTFTMNEPTDNVAAFSFDLGNSNVDAFFDNITLTEVEEPTTVEDNHNEAASLPTDFNLLQNYPNPFNPETRISYELAEQTKVVLKVLNLLGQEIRTLVDGDEPAGIYEVTWDGRNTSGQRVASGVYLYRLESNSGFTRTRKMVFLQ